MRDILLVSRWFYPGPFSILELLASCILAALAAVTAGLFLSGRSNRIAILAAQVFCAAGALVCAAMIAAEVVVFEFAVPLAALSYTALMFSFAALFYRFPPATSIAKRSVASLVASTLALTYLFFYGAVPPIAPLESAGLDRGANVLGGRVGTLPVTEFADFECPPCAVQDRIMDRIWDAYSDRITYTFRHFPKARHRHAQPAAVASQCAAESGAFWDTKRLLFSNQGRLAEVLSRVGLPTIPVSQTERFARCIEAQSTLSTVDQDRMSAAGIGIRVTPSIVVGDVLIEGIVRYPRLALIVERELRERGPAQARRTSVRISDCGSLSLAKACSE